MSEIEREAMEYDVVIVGRTSWIVSRNPFETIGRRSERCRFGKRVRSWGAHPVGCCFGSCGSDAFDARLKEKGAPLNVPVKEDNFYVLGEAGQTRLPNFVMPPLMNNHGNYIVSMGNVCRWMAEQAESMGVEIFPGMAASEVVYGDTGEVKGVVAGVFGLEVDGSIGENTEPGMELHGKYVFFSEGARGSLVKRNHREIWPRCRL